MARDKHYHPAGKGPSCGAYWEEWDKYMESAYEMEVLNSETGEAMRFASGKVHTRTRHKLPRPLRTTNVADVMCYCCLIELGKMIMRKVREKAAL